MLLRAAQMDWDDFLAERYWVHVPFTNGSDRDLLTFDSSRSVRSGQSPIRPADGFFLKLLPVFFCFGNLGLLACF